MLVNIGTLDTDLLQVQLSDIPREGEMLALDIDGTTIYYIVGTIVHNVKPIPQFQGVMDHTVTMTVEEMDVKDTAESIADEGEEIPDENLTKDGYQKDHRTPDECDDKPPTD